MVGGFAESLEDYYWWWCGGRGCVWMGVGLVVGWECLDDVKVGVVEGIGDWWLFVFIRHLVMACFILPIADKHPNKLLLLHFAH